jgi:hypothetical protein
MAQGNLLKEKDRAMMKAEVFNKAETLDVLIEQEQEYIKLSAPKGYVFMSNNRHETLTGYEDNESNTWKLVMDDLIYGIEKCSEITCESFNE